MREGRSYKVGWAVTRHHPVFSCSGVQSRCCSRGKWPGKSKSLSGVGPWRKIRAYKTMCCSAVWRVPVLQGAEVRRGQGLWTDTVCFKGRLIRGSRSLLWDLSSSALDREGCSQLPAFLGLQLGLVFKLVPGSVLPVQTARFREVFACTFLMKNFHQQDSSV